MYCYRLIMKNEFCIVLLSVKSPGLIILHLGVYVCILMTLSFLFFFVFLLIVDICYSIFQFSDKIVCHRSITILYSFFTFLCVCKSDLYSTIKSRLATSSRIFAVYVAVIVMIASTNTILLSDINATIKNNHKQYLCLFHVITADVLDEDMDCDE